MIPTNPGKAYRQHAIQSENIADIFIQAYNQAVTQLYAAAQAAEARDIEKKTLAVNRALAIIIHLQGAIDFEHGGEVAQSLNQFYTLIRQDIFRGSAKLDAGVLRQAATYVMEVRNVWEHAQSIVPKGQVAAPYAQNDTLHSHGAGTTLQDPTAVPSGGWTA